MKATGIVRRVDDLGRIVIPKEIRRTLRIREGDPLEIYTEKDGGVIFRKYSPMGDLQDFAAQMCEAIGSNTGRIAAVSDRDAVIALSGAPKRELLDKPNSRELGQLMEQRRNYRYESGAPAVPAVEGADYRLGVAAPILSQGDLMGCVMLLLNEGEGNVYSSFSCSCFVDLQIPEPGIFPLQPGEATLPKNSTHSKTSCVNFQPKVMIKLQFIWSPL